MHVLADLAAENRGHFIPFFICFVFNYSGMEDNVS